MVPCLPFASKSCSNYCFKWTTTFWFKRNPQSDEDSKINSENLLLGSRTRLRFVYTTGAFLEPNGRDMLLVVIYLYQNLPQYVRKTTIEFYGVLGDG